MGNALELDALEVFDEFAEHTDATCHAVLRVLVGIGAGMLLVPHGGQLGQSLLDLIHAYL